MYEVSIIHGEGSVSLPLFWDHCNPQVPFSLYEESGFVTL